MSGLVRGLGFDPANNVSVFLFCAIFTFAVVTILWVVGLVPGQPFDGDFSDGWKPPASSHAACA
jgi:hypothetical protein